MVLVLGIDHGNKNVKARSDSAKKFLRPSAFARSTDFAEDSVTGNGKLDLIEFESTKFEGEVYKWGEDINKATKQIQTFGSENRYTQKPYRLLSEFILSELLPKNANTFDDVLVVTGCPSQEKGTALEEELIKAYADAHVVKANGKSRMINVGNVLVLPQPLGTVLYLYLNDEGYVANEDYEMDYVGVIDLGSGTSDLDGIKGLKRVKEDTETIPAGAFSVYQKIADYINSEKPEAKATPESVELQILSAKNEDEANSYVISKRSKVDITEKKAQYFREHAEDIINKINQRWPNRSKFDKLLLTGGLAKVLFEFFKAWESDIILVEDSQNANAIGFYRYGKFKTLGGSSGK